MLRLTVKNVKVLNKVPYVSQDFFKKIFGEIYSRISKSPDIIQRLKNNTHILKMIPKAGTI